MASKIVINGKCQRPSVCNAVENAIRCIRTSQMHFLPDMAKMLIEMGVALRGVIAALRVGAGDATRRRKRIMLTELQAHPAP